MNKIKRALISVSDKKNLLLILKILKKYNIQLISSGGTYIEIKKLGFKCLEVSKFTDSPEILEGRVKTLHPKIHAGILSKRNNQSNKRDLKKYNYKEIDLVIVNFYPFEEILKKNNFKSSGFEIRFHLMPDTKVTKTQDGKSVLIELENSGWRFSSSLGHIGIETGLYFGKKNTYKENQNIFISGVTQKEDQIIEWELNKI